MLNVQKQAESISARLIHCSTDLVGHLLHYDCSSLNHAFAQARHDDSEELQGAGLQSEHQQVRYGILQADIVLTSTAQSGLFILDMPNWSNAYQNARRHVRECITLLTPAARYGGGL